MFSVVVCYLEGSEGLVTFDLLSSVTLQHRHLLVEPQHCRNQLKNLVKVITTLPIH